MSGSWIRTLIKELFNKEFRDAYVEEDIRTGIAFQIRALREKHGWSQSELGRRAGKPQSVISRLEDPNYGRLSLQTLLELASSFDVALLVRFVAYSELIERNADLTPEAMAVPSYAEDQLRERQAPHLGPIARFAEGMGLNEPAGKSGIGMISIPRRSDEQPFAGTRRRGFALEGSAIRHHQLTGFLSGAGSSERPLALNRPIGQVDAPGVYRSEIPQ